MNSKRLLYFFSFSFIAIITVMLFGCAQIGVPTGGPKDSIPPKLVVSTPELNKTNFTGKEISFTFDEYIVVDDPTKNVLVSPYPKSNPQVNFKLKTVTVKLKDTLLPNTTYAINFGNAIKDNNEGNLFRDFTYVFSTGPTIDSLQFSGQVILAETGKKDSTLMALLYRNTDDTMVQHRRPDYVARVDRDGKFTFRNLSKDTYKVYALKDNDGRKTYNDKTELFAFSNTDINVSEKTDSVTLYAYAEEKDKKNTTPPKALPEKRLKYTVPVPAADQSLLTTLDISFNRPLKSFDAEKIQVTDSLYNKIPGISYSLDSNSKILSLKTSWKDTFAYRLIIDSAAVTDTFSAHLAKNDTIKFKSKGAADYGSLLIRFKKLDTAKHQVLQIFKADVIYKTVRITTASWSDKLFEPGEYELRILFDTNDNGEWDPGNYEKKLQPERAITLDKKLNIRASWDNEREVEL
ncbi:MAG: Ig-like domain-containing protein [Ferruginibacter sp.]